MSNPHSPWKILNALKMSLLYVKEEREETVTIKTKVKNCLPSCDSLEFELAEENDDLCELSHKEFRSARSVLTVIAFRRLYKTPLHLLISLTKLPCYSEEAKCTQGLWGTAESSALNKTKRCICHDGYAQMRLLTMTAEEAFQMNDSLNG